MSSRLQELNPRATINVLSHCSVSAYVHYSMVIFSNMDCDSLAEIQFSSFTIPFFAVYGNGAYSYIIYLNIFDFTLLRLNKEQLQARNPDSTLWRLRSQPIVHSPVAIAAILGGFMTEFIVSSLSGEDKMDSVFELDGFSMNGTMYSFLYVCVL